VESQNAAISPFGSMRGRLAERNKPCPLVPRLKLTIAFTDGCRLPIALIILSPPPVLTGVAWGQS